MRAARIKCFLFPLFAHNSLLHKLAAVGSGTASEFQITLGFVWPSSQYNQRNNCIIASFPQHSIV